MKTHRMIQFPTAARAGFLAALFAAIPATAPAVLAGPCVRATVGEQVTLPDGSVHAPGEIRICVTRSYSPVSDFDSVSVGGQSVGLFVGRRKLSEDLPKGLNAVMVFEREAGSGLRLVGFGLRERDRFEVRSFGSRPGKHAGALENPQPVVAANPAAEESTTSVMIKAAAH